MNRLRTTALMMLMVTLLAAPLYLNAQDIGTYRPHPGGDGWDGDDGRLNQYDYMDGIGVYCADETHTPWDNYENGGFVVLAPNSEAAGAKEVLWVPEAQIEAGIAQATATGQNTLLGQAQGTWFDPQPAIYYLPASGEFQLNVVGGYTDKLFEFQWTECRTVPKVTNDGCPPGKDDTGNGCG